MARRLPSAGAVKVHKLLYYCQGWHLAWTGAPLFAEEIEAWANGPVVADLWHDEDKSRSAPPASELPEDAHRTVGYVASRYGRLSGKELIRLTHGERPWLDVSESDAWRSPVISHAALAAFFTADDERTDLDAAFDSALADPATRMLFEASIERAGATSLQRATIRSRSSVASTLFVDDRGRVVLRAPRLPGGPGHQPTDRSDIGPPRGLRRLTLGTARPIGGTSAVGAVVRGAG